MKYAYPRSSVRVVSLSKRAIEAAISFAPESVILVSLLIFFRDYFNVLVKITLKCAYPK